MPRKPTSGRSTGTAITYGTRRSWQNAQRRVPSVAGIGHEPGNANAGWDSSRLAALPVVGPARGQVELPIEESMPVHRGVGQHHHALTVLRLPGPTAVLRGNANTLVALLDGLRVVGDQRPARIRQSMKDTRPHRVAPSIDVPHRPLSRYSNGPGVGNPACSANSHEFFFATSASIARTINPNVTLRTVEQPPQPIRQRLKPSIPGINARPTWLVQGCDSFGGGR